VTAAEAAFDSIADAEDSHRDDFQVLNPFGTRSSSHNATQYPYHIALKRAQTMDLFRS